MSCNCKNSGEMPQNYVLEENENLVATIIKYIVKFIGFLVGVALLPLIMIAIIWFMFDTIVLNKDIDLRKVINRFVVANKFFTREEEEDKEDEEDDDDYLTENDVIMLNVEDITNKSK